MVKRTRSVFEYLVRNCACCEFLNKYDTSSVEYVVPHLLAAIVRNIYLHSVERRRDRYIIMTACGAYWDDTLPILTYNCQGVVG